MVFHEKERLKTTTTQEYRYFIVVVTLIALPTCEFAPARSPIAMPHAGSRCLKSAPRVTKSLAFSALYSKKEIIRVYILF
jgi:hypothetical protein